MRSMRFVVGALICALSVTLAACQKQKQWIEINFPTGPSAATECNDGRNNDPDEDNLIDAADPGCHRNNDLNQPYDPTDNSERNGGGGPVVSGRPGDFNLFGTCVGSRVRLSWSHSDRADGYFVERRLWTTGAWVRLSRFYSVSERTNVEVDADLGAANYWRVVAVNAAGETFSRSPEERDDKTATFACGPPAPQCSNGIDDDRDGKIDFGQDPGCSSREDNNEADDPSTGGPGPTPPGGGGPTGPPTGGSCSGASASLPDLTGRGQTRGFNISIPAGCQWSLTSNNHHVVSVNPASGTGPASGSVTSLNAGSATISFVVGGVVVSSRTYTIP